MSSLAHSMQKKVQINNMTFPPEMYNNIIGSLVICAFIFGTDKTKETIKRISECWKELVKHPGNADNVDFSDQGGIDTALSIFGLKRPEVFSIAFVQSKYNALFAPFVDGKVLPIREDGFMGITLRTGKVYPVLFDADKTTD